MRTISSTTLMLILVLAACIGGDTMAPNAVISVPTSLRADPGDGIVTLSWSPVPGATAYNLYWSTHPGVTSRTGTRIAGLGSAYTQSGLVNGTAYYYVVTASNSQQESRPSSEIHAAPIVIPMVLSTSAPPAATVGQPYDGLRVPTPYLCNYSNLTTGCAPCSAMVHCSGVRPCGVPVCVKTVMTQHGGGWMVTARGGRLPYSSRVSALPPGLTSTDVSDGVSITGTPTAAGSYVVTVTLADSDDPRQTATVADTIVINP